MLSCREEAASIQFSSKQGVHWFLVILDYPQWQEKTIVKSPVAESVRAAGFELGGLQLAFPDKVFSCKENKRPNWKGQGKHSWGLTINSEDHNVILNRFQQSSKKQSLRPEMHRFAPPSFFFFVVIFLFCVFCLQSYSFRHPELFEIMERKPCRYSDRNGNYCNTRA